MVLKVAAATLGLQSARPNPAKSNTQALRSEWTRIELSSGDLPGHRGILEEPQSFARRCYKPLLSSSVAMCSMPSSGVLLAARPVHE